MSQGHDRPARPPVILQVIDGIEQAIACASEDGPKSADMMVAERWANAMKEWMEWARGYLDQLLAVYVAHNEDEHDVWLAQQDLIDQVAGATPWEPIDCKVCAYLQNKLSDLGSEAL